MAKGKEFPLSLRLRTINDAMSGLRRMNAQLRSAVGPVNRLNDRMRRTWARARRGLAGVGRALKRVAIGLGAAAAAAGYAFKRMVSEGDKLAKTADRVGLTVDALAQLRFAAGQSGVAARELDKGMEGFAKRLGEAKAGTGSLTSFLKRASPALLKQLKGAKNSEEAFGLMADAMAKLQDPAKEAALANAAFGRSGVRMANLLRQGSGAVDVLRQEYATLAGPQEAAARQSEKVVDAMGRVSAAMTGAKASIIQGISPALLRLSERATKFFVENRGAIQGWINDFGRKLPGRIETLVGALKRVGSVMATVLSHAKEIAIAFGAFKIGTGLVGAFGKGAGAMSTFAGRLGAATGALGGFYLWLRHRANEGDKEHARSIDAQAERGSVRRNLLDPRFGAGGSAGLAKARGSGLIDAKGRINRKALAKNLDAEGRVARFDAQDRAGGLLGKLNAPAAQAARAKLDREIDQATAGIAAGLHREFTSKIASILSAERRQIAQGLAEGTPIATSQGRIQIDISGAPKGTRVNQDSRNTGIDLTTGYQLGAP